jgi:hypothetical protein
MRSSEDVATSARVAVAGMVAGSRTRIEWPLLPSFLLRLMPTLIHTDACRKHRTALEFL